LFCGAGRPTQKDIYARRLIQAHAAQQAQVAFDGKRLGMPAIRAAQQVLAKAQAAGKTQ